MVCDFAEKYHILQTHISFRHHFFLTATIEKGPRTSILPICLNPVTQNLKLLHFQPSWLCSNSGETKSLEGREQEQSSLAAQTEKQHNIPDQSRPCMCVCVCAKHCVFLTEICRVSGTEIMSQRDSVSLCLCPLMLN